MKRERSFSPNIIRSTSKDDLSPPVDLSNQFSEETNSVERNKIFQNLSIAIKENNFEFAFKLLEHLKEQQKRKYSFNNSNDINKFQSSSTFLTNAGHMGIKFNDIKFNRADEKTDIYKHEDISNNLINAETDPFVKDHSLNDNNETNGWYFKQSSILKREIELEQYENELCPLHIACEFGTPAMVGLLLKYYNPNTIDNISSKTPLQVAIENGQIQNAIKLCNSGADTNLRLVGYDSPLTLAIRNGNATLVENLLFHYKSNPNDDYWSITSTPMYECCKKRNNIILDILRRAGCNIDYACGPLKYTVLHQLVLEGDIEGCRMILEKKKYRSNIFQQDANGLSAIHLAASVPNQSKIIKLLYRYNADINLITVKFGRVVSPLGISILAGSYENVQALLNLNADINLRMIDEIHPNQQITVLSYAVETGNEKIVSLLLKYKPELEVPYDCTPLFLSCKKGFENISRLLLDEGARTEVFDKLKFTPLMIACKKGHYKVVKLLLQRKCIVNQVNGEKESALHIAAREGHIRILKLLLRYGSDSQIRNLKRQTALHISCELKHSDIVEVLLRHNAKLKQIESNENDFKPTQKLQNLLNDLITTQSTGNKIQTQDRKKLKETKKVNKIKLQ